MLADWLVSEGVTLSAMESTATYWKPVFYCLEERMECWLLNAGHMKAVPGRKSDVKDAEWIAQLLEHGLVRPSFVPPPDIRRLRNLTRYRVQLMGDRTRDATRLEKLLEDASIKLSVVASNIIGYSRVSKGPGFLGQVCCTNFRRGRTGPHKGRQPGCGIPRLGDRDARHPVMSVQRDERAVSGTGHDPKVRGRVRQSHDGS